MTHPSPTIKITFQGFPDDVEAAVQKARTCFEVTYESKNKRISTRPGQVRRYLRIIPPEQERR